MAAKQKNNYFHMMKAMVACALEAAEMLDETLHSFSTDALVAKLHELHEIEHRGDRLKHDLVNNLAKEFITPIEREDIMAIASQIDDVTDALEDVLLKISMFNIQSIPETAKAFASLITQCVRALLVVMSELEDFKKSKTMHASLVELNDLEEQGDKLYYQGVRELFVNRTDPLLAMSLTDVYAYLELCCDTCEHTADLVEHVIMKNT